MISPIVDHSQPAMRWPPWESKESKESKEIDLIKWPEILNATDWAHYTDARNVVPVVLLTSTALGSYAFYRSYLRRIPQAGLIGPRFWRKRSLFGRVTSVGDGDNFRLFHTPGGILAGWGWLPGRKIPKKRSKDQTISIRMAGIDAPEGAHFGRTPQPGSQEALDWLRSYILHRRVRAYIYKKDQYHRAVSTVYVRRGLLRRDVGLEMLKRGLATVYEAKGGIEWGGMEARYRKAERSAKSRKLGIWGGDMTKFESPRNYKNRQGIVQDYSGN